MKRIAAPLILIMTIAVMAVFTACSSLPENGEAVDVYFFKVGKADSMLIRSDGEYMLIDAAEDEDGEKLLGWLDDAGVETLDYLVLTHFDKDHVGGADYVVNGVEIGEIYRPDYEADSVEYGQYKRALNEAGMADTVLTADTEIMLGSAHITLMPSRSSEYAEENDYSIAARLEFAGSSVLFTGDAEEARIDELLAEGVSNCSIIKMPHHGRSKDNLSELLDAAAPEYAVLTASDKNPPEDDTLALLDERGIEYFVTRDGSLLARLWADGSIEFAR